ncbi:L-threonylcarbamoyladenylate synthase [Synechococcus sp. M16CYN]|uniref:L-threonylcarbamoyladenylate synthase n=1 Tax=Synechococcus sp. M16CYN TaxID=3103139 RepID=UPI00324C2B53
MTVPLNPIMLGPTSLVRHLQASEVVIIPTDTLPGLAVLPEYAQRIWEFKQRPADKPLILMGATADALLCEVDPVCYDDARALAEQHWPGALTLVLPAQGNYVDHLNPGGVNLGCRLPACSMTRELLTLSGPLATSSANLSGKPAATNAFEAAQWFPAVAQLGPQPWPLHSGQASTILIWTGLHRWHVARHGAVMPEGLNEAE